MAAIAINYVVNPLHGFWKGVQRFVEVAGYARAAAELSRLGYYKEAKACMMQIQKLKSK
jgi:hypothetical protein